MKKKFYILLAALSVSTGLIADEWWLEDGSVVTDESEIKKEAHLL